MDWIKKYIFLRQDAMKRFFLIVFRLESKGKLKAYMMTTINLNATSY